MQINTKYSCGDKVFKIQQDWKTEFVKCDFCSGGGRVLGKNRESRPCPDCYGRKGKNVSGGKEWRVVEELTIGQVRFSYTGKSDGYDPDSIFNNYGPKTEVYEEVYMCQETGVDSGSLHCVDTLFPTQESAQAECDTRNQTIGP